MRATVRPRMAACAHALAALAAAGILIAVSAVDRPGPQAPVADEEVYARLALGLAEFGVLGRYRASASAPEADGEVTPLYPSFLAAVIALAPDLREGLICVLARAPKERKERGACRSGQLGAIVVAQGMLAALFLVSIWGAARVLTGSVWIAWLSLGTGWISDVPADFTHVFMTEALGLPLFGAFTLWLALARDRPGELRWTALAGLTLGLLALTRPTYVYLLGFLVAGATSVFLVRGVRRRTWAGLALFVVAAGAVMTPWAVRNAVHFDRFALSVGGYGGRALAQRVSFNRMSPAEWAVGFVYWFPNVGDSIAERLFPERLWRVLGIGEGSYYRDGATRLTERTRAAAGGEDAHVAYLIRNGVLDRPVKHLAVSAVLVWKGMFVGKLWGVLAWGCVVWVVGRSARDARADYLLLCLPAFFMLVFHAGVSVSIPRYNVVLVPVLAIAMACVVERLARLAWRGSTSA